MNGAVRLVLRLVGRHVIGSRPRAPLQLCTAVRACAIARQARQGGQATQAGQNERDAPPDGSSGVAGRQNVVWRTQCAWESSATSTRTTKLSAPCWRRTGRRGSTSSTAWATPSATAARPNECADLVREVAKTTILGNHDAAVERPDGLLVLLRGRPPRARRPRRDADASRTWRGSRRSPTRRCSTEIDVLLCHGSPVRLEEFEYIFAPEQARECLAIWDQHRAHHAHRPLAPLQGLRAHADHRRGAARRSTSSSKTTRSTSSASARSASRATSTTARATRSTTATRKRFEFKRIEYDIELAADKVLRARLERNFAHRLFIGV